jgi:hypothetical protein
MNIKPFNVAVGIVLTATTISASAQKTYTHGTIAVNMPMQGQQVDAKQYFTSDSTALSFTAGPATIKVLIDAKETLIAVLVDVPVASMKKAAIYTPAEIEQALEAFPKFTFAPSTDTKQISGFNCKKVVATDTKTNKTYDVWITNDITLPPNAIPKYYAAIGGVPIQYTSFSQGQETPITITGITDEKAPAGTFSIPADFDKISLDDLKAMSGGGN